MSRVKETLRQLIAFSEQQQAIKKRKLALEGKTQANVTVDAYATIIESLSGTLGDEDASPDDRGNDYMK